MHLDELTLGQVKQLISTVGGVDGDCPGPWKIGEKYLWRGVTNYMTGRLVAVYPQELVFEDAAWIADTGRFSKALSSGELSEIEPVEKGTVIVGRGSLSDAELWHHDLPRAVK